MARSYRPAPWGLMSAPTSMPCLADARHHKDEDIRKYRKVCLAFSDAGAQNYVSVAGDAEVLDDRSIIRELWGIPAKAWWNSPDDPNIRLLKVTPLDAQYWDAPGATVFAAAPSD
jgi:general stress protein 26